MEPKSHEHMPSPIEATPSLPLNPEHQTSDGHEQLRPTLEVGNERAPQEQASSPSPVVQLPTPIAQTAAAVPTDTNAATTDDSTPQIAADEDLIEKEWVDKAKKVIAETKDDPHAREQEIGKLQVDYLKKRYGKELGNQE